ncbi:unnamed protein product [Miscanthus lutarioriparius]|uniref:Reverse transcriptase zinc-binding domain-containing protein n=1 Tax=Miscanthus lutarioriparius TaxID=422564 RepID=A0A811NS95_9POAL|nr:unnamed protein product [Miscanthus lutarioriparius]
MAGKEILQKGMIRRIEDGGSTNIWQDRWIPMHFDARPLTPRADQEIDLVSDLLTESGHWNEELIRESFIPVDARAILRLPVRQQGEDWWAWEPEKHGVYSVKSAYRKLATEHTQGDTLQPQASGDISWQRIWGLDVPPKVKVFWGRVLHEFLPAKAILHHRHIEPLAFCDLCGAEQETIKHVLMDCTVAKLFWHEVKALTGAKLPKMHTQFWASDILRPEFCTDKERGLFIIGMYALWSQRNQRRHGENVPPIRVAVNWAVDLAHDLWQITQEKKPVKPVTVRQNWRPPPSGWCKCNVDAAFDANAGQGATAVVLRSDDGSFGGGRARWYPH